MINNINTVFFCHMQNLEDVEPSEDSEDLSDLSPTSGSSCDETDISDVQYDPASSFIENLRFQLGAVSSGYKTNLSHYFLYCRNYSVFLV